MSIYKDYSVGIGSRLVLNSEYSFTDVRGKIGAGEVFYITGIRESDDYLEYESENEFEHYSVHGFDTGKMKIKGAFHITSNVSEWFDLTKRDENLKILLDE